MDFKAVKLIIWDLDETFWSGTISENEVNLIDANIEFLKDVTDIGIVNSICSKNDFNVVKTFLEKEQLWDYFVFPSIDWTPKGQRIKTIIETMKLRPENVLFVDDNIQNLEEAKHFCPKLMTALPESIIDFKKEIGTVEKKDLGHKRLLQYKQLEEKEEVRSEFSSNDEFLMSCDIEVEICYDCEEEVERIYELVMRSNQLNYTKYRQDKEGLAEIIKDESYITGFVRAKDKFGDYGIVGFFTVKNDKLIHFAFSCRTLGMKIEQYVYYELGCPTINIIGEVASELNLTDKPKWINKGTNSSKPIKFNKSTVKKILFKGPCDMSQMYSFLDFQEGATTEFTYMNDKGVSIEGHNHTSQIVTALYSDEKRKSQILSDAEFFDKDMLATSMENQKYDYIVISMLTDGNLGVYRRNETGEEIALCEKKYSLTDQKNHEKYINGDCFTSYIKFTKEMLEDFSSKYSFVDNTDASLTVNNLQKIWNFVGLDTQIILLLGSERKFLKPCKESYLGRDSEHAIMNKKITQWAQDKPNVVLIPFDKYIKSDSDFIDTINHFVKRVYYDLACDLAAIFSDGDEKVEVKSKMLLYKLSLKQKLRVLKKRLFS